jgi:hypothetical protein
MTNALIRDLGDGLILRHGTPEDEEALAKFNREIHGEGEWDAKGLEDWTRDLVSGDSPTFKPGDITVVEDTATGEIVSTCCLISQTWSYDGIPFKVGRPELVGTKKEYRRRGLIRRQFEVLHEWSAARGEQVQIITGIPNYYRQFGYEMTLSLSGGRAGYELHVPKLKEDETEPYTFRPAKADDIPFLMRTYESGCNRSLISAVRDEAEWRYELTGKRQYNINHRDVYIIESTEQRPVGFIAVPPIKWAKNNVLDRYELTPDMAWADVNPSVIRFLWQRGEELAKEQNQTQNMFGFWLGEDHPVYHVMTTLLPRERESYAFYVRVPDVAAFLKTIQPRIEANLAASPFVNHTGKLKLSFYTNGVLLDFEKGKLKSIAPLTFDELEKSDVRFPAFTFLHLLFGHRTIEELAHIYADLETKDKETKELIGALFPKKISHVWPIS